MHYGCAEFYKFELFLAEFDLSLSDVGIVSSEHAKDSQRPFLVAYLTAKENAGRIQRYGGYSFMFFNSFNSPDFLKRKFFNFSPS